MMSQANELQDIASLGSSHDVNDAVNNACIQLVAAMYKAPKMAYNNSNEIRCALAEKMKKPTAKSLPPTMDTLRLHIKRVIYQLVVWKNATVGIHEILDPYQFGFQRQGTNMIVPQMMTQASAAPELLNDLICSCTEGGCHVNCACLYNEQPCTAQCGCNVEEELDGCNNLYTWLASPDADIVEDMGS